MKGWLAWLVLCMPMAAQADLWGYVDGKGVAHIAAMQLDSRYRLVIGNAAADAHVPGKSDSAGGVLTWLEFAPEVKSLQGIFREAARTHGVDVELLKAVILVESGFDAHAVSPRGAVGLMQIMPIGKTKQAKAAMAETLREPRTNVLTGARMLAHLIRRYGRTDVALAAWNAGEGTVKKYGGVVPPIAETQAHVHLVLELYWAQMQNNLSRGARDLQLHGASASER